jgi:hypothetical protein
VDFDTAFWEPNLLLMAYGNGGFLFKDLTGDLDVSGHELTHGVTQFTAGLIYNYYQSGALNESFSDMLGSAIDAWANTGPLTPTTGSSVKTSWPTSSLARRCAAWLSRGRPTTTQS